jgi:hypothetical protein
MNIKTDTSGENPLANDLLRGAKAIGEFIAEPDTRVYYLAECGYLPIGKIGTALIASKKTLREHYDRLCATGGTTRRRAARRGKNPDD